MRVLAIAAIVLIGFCSRRAHGGGFEFGNGVAVTNGMAAVNFNTDKGGRLSVMPGFPVGLVEIRVTFTNGTTQRTSLLYAGTHGLKVPMTVEIVELLGGLSVLALFSGALILLTSMSGAMRAEPGASPNAGSADIPPSSVT